MDSGTSFDKDRPIDRLLEGLASVLALIGVGVLFGNKLAAYACFFGSCSTPTTSNVVTYWVATAIVAILVALTLRSALRRQSGPALAWHVIVAVVAGLAILIFSVPAIDLYSDVVDPPLPPPPTGCFGDNCLGG